MAQSDDIERILLDASDTLQTAEFGLADLESPDPKRRMAGLRNLVVFGRAVTNVLQKLRTPLGSDFENWYSGVQKELRADQLMKFFYDLRSEILKEGSIGPLSVHTHIQSFGPEDQRRLWATAPPGLRVISWVIGSAETVGT